MKVLLVTNNFTPYSGGVVSSLQVLAQELQRNGIKVKLVTLSFLEEHDDPSWVERMHCPIKFLYKSNHMALAWRADKKMAQIINAFQPDIVHVHHPFLLGVTALQVAKSLNIPVVFTYHTLYEAYAHYVPLPAWMVRSLLKRRIGWFCKAVDAIIAPSTYVKHRLRAQDIQTTIQVIPSGLLSEYMPDHLKKNTKTELHVLSVGRMVPEKNLICLLDVIKQLYDEGVKLKATFIGYGSEYNSLQAYAYDLLKLPQETVIFIHKPPKEIIAQAYAQADLFLFASATDTQALVLAEAMAAGTPVISLDGPGQRDIIMQGQNGYIVQTKQEMAWVIKELYSAPNRLEQLSEGALKTAKRYYPGEIVKQVVAFYETCI